MKGLSPEHTALADIGCVGRRLFSLRLGEQITQVPRPFFDRITLLGGIREAVIDPLHPLFLVVKNTLCDFVLDAERGEARTTCATQIVRGERFNADRLESV